ACGETDRSDRIAGAVLDRPGAPLAVGRGGCARSGRRARARVRHPLQEAGRRGEGRAAPLRPDPLTANAPDCRRLLTRRPGQPRVPGAWWPTARPSAVLLQLSAALPRPSAAPPEPFGPRRSRAAGRPRSGRAIRDT